MFKTISTSKLLLILMTCLLYHQSAFAETTEEMLSSCRPLAKVEVSGGIAKFPENFETGMCWGAFSIVQTIIVARSENNSLIFGVCVPEETKRTQLISVFMSYAESKPKRLHEDFFPVVLDGLRESFPCKNKTY